MKLVIKIRSSFKSNVTQSLFTSAMLLILAQIAHVFQIQFLSGFLPICDRFNFDLPFSEASLDFVQLLVILKNATVRNHCLELEQANRFVLVFLRVITFFG